ncbi:MAG: FTR1 family protein [Pseudanabaenaceae cyanobacterium bins.68]|nr:FTR1 family protein [Pseudanabaenaceae cyanobacterium bins.68]
MDLSAALPVFVITLREGVEATLIIGIVMACLEKANAPRLIPAVYGGAAAGLGVSVGLGSLLQLVLGAVVLSSWPYSQALQQGLKGTVAVVAIALLSWMLIWMTQQAKGLKAELETAVQNSTAMGIFSLIFVDVLREGVETVLFLGGQQGAASILGAIAGLSGAVLIGWLIFRLGVKINLKRFFQVMGVLLLLIVGGLVITALRKFEAMVGAIALIDPSFADFCALKDSCILGVQVWDLSHSLPDRQFPGILLKTLFGYSQKLYLAQAIAYSSFLAVVGSLYWRSLNPSKP